MSTPLQAAHPAAPDDRRVRRDAPRPSAVLWQTALLGLAGDALLRNPAPGPAIAAWVLVLALASVALAWSAGRRVPRQAMGWLGTALLFALLTVWRGAEALAALDMLAALGALGMAAVSYRDTRRALWAPRLRDTAWAGVAVVRQVLRGIVPLALRELFAAERGSGATRHARPVIRASLIVAGLALVFGSLLRGADPIFARLVALPDLDFGAMTSHAAFAFVCAWLAGGWLHGALVDDCSRNRAPDSLPMSLGMLEVTTALGTLTVLFGAFMLTQLGWLFGGERFLQATTGLTAATYARQGFFQMVLVVMLALPLLLGTRAALQPGAALARRHTALSIPVVVLLGAMVLSAAARMQLYVHYYGLTIDRLHTLVFMGWLGIVLVLLAATVLRDRGRPFVAGAALSGLATLALLHVVVPDVVVARVNVARAAASPSIALDVAHLARLSADAADFATTATLSEPVTPSSIDPTAAAADRCSAARALLGRWGPDSPARERSQEPDGWRSWNAAERHALRVVETHASALHAVARANCARVPRAAS